MNVMLGLLIPALVGVDYGWQQKPDGTINYIVQVDAETFAEMQKNGQTIGSALPTEVRGMISDFSFRIGKETLPNQNTLPSVATPVRINANYPPSSDVPGASTAPAGSTVTNPTPTQYNWGGAPPSVSIPQTAAPPGTQSWSQNTVPASSATTQPAMSTSGFPINPTAPPNPFPTNPTSATSSAYPNSTAPPSLNNGPRISQPQPWQTPPREVTISARTPMEPNPPLSSTNTQAGPNLNPAAMPGTGGYSNGVTPPGYNNNGYPQNNPGYPTGPLVPSNGPPQYATNNYPPNNGQGQQNYPQQGNQLPPPNDPYFAQRQTPTQQQPMQPQQQQLQREPMATAGVNNVGTQQPTTNTAAKSDDDFTVRVALLLIGFLTSLAANFYFGWNTYQLRERCRMLLTDRGSF